MEIKFVIIKHSVLATIHDSYKQQMPERIIRFKIQGNERALDESSPSSHGVLRPHPHSL